MTIKSLYLASLLCFSFTLSACNHDDNDKNGSNTNANTVQNGQVSQVEVVKPVVASDTNSNTINSNANASSQTTTKPLPLPPGVNILITGNTTVIRFKSGNDKNSGVSVTSSTGNIINNNTTDGNQINNVQIVSGNNNSVVNTNSGNGVQMNIIQHTKGNHNQNQVVIEGDDNNANGAVNGNGGDADVNDKHIHTTGSIDSIVQENGVTTITITGDAHPVITQIH
jgi:hypothetical protein